VIASAGRARTVRLLPWRRLRTVDWALLAAVMVAIAAGTAMIYSATLRSPVTNAWDDLVVKQVVFALLGIGALVVVSATDYRVLLALAAWLYIVTVAALAVLLVGGTVLGGSMRWFDVGAAALQPSEFTKLTLIVTLAAYFDRFDVRRTRHLLGSLLLAAVPMVLVYLQPNLSTALLLGVIWLGMVFAAGIRVLHLAALALVATPLLVIGLQAGLQGYMRARIVGWLNPLADPLDAGFQNIQTLIAVGNGGLHGTGYASGYQAQGGWLPVLYTDNIFALVAEELGFLGGVALLGVLLFVVWRVLRAASVAQDEAGALLACGVAIYILVQTLVNVGVVLQLLPVTGLSLPFVSYGGSSLVALLTSIGLVQSVLVRRKPLEFHT
jgi:rod shape determining protein RodA